MQKISSQKFLSGFINLVSREMDMYRMLTVMKMAEEKRIVLHKEQKQTKTNRYGYIPLKQGLKAKSKGVSKV